MAIGNLVCFFNTVVLPINHSGEILYLVAAIYLTTAIQDVSAMLRKPVAIFNLAMNALSIAYLVFRVEYLHRPAILVIFGLFFIWRSFLVQMWIKTLEEHVQVKQLEAYKATVVMLNHQFNNVATSAIMLADMMTSKNKQDLPPAEDLQNRFLRTLRHLIVLINRVTQMESYRSENYVGKTPMVSIVEERRSREKRKRRKA